MADTSNKVTIDVANASVEELKKVQGLIMARLVQDVHAQFDPAALYDSHGSSHTSNSPSMRVSQQTKP